MKKEKRGRRKPCGRSLPGLGFGLNLGEFANETSADTFFETHHNDALLSVVTLLKMLRH